MPDRTKFDFIIVGGGTAGCVVASRLHEAHPHLAIALIEAGPDASDNPKVQDPRLAALLQDTDLMWKYESTPQESLGGRQLINWGGKLLSGSSGVNYTAWIRGNSADYDLWAQKVSDSRWSYDGLLPFFRRSEHWHDEHFSIAGQHGFEGPVRTQSGDFGFPLRVPMRKGFQAAGFDFNVDMNAGDANGIAPLVVNWYGLKRQHASVCYPLEGVHVVVDTVVARVLTEGSEDDAAPKVTGVELAGSGEVLHASREVIISCGGIRTPQLLMLSGIGPAAELAKHGITQRVQSPGVGANLMDHPAVTMFWQIKNPEQGLAFGSDKFNKPSYENSLPMDWMIAGKAPDEDLERAARVDMVDFERRARSDYELAPMYLSNAAVPKPWLQMDGKHLSCGIMCLSATSRGSLTLSSTDPYANPVLDPRYLSTEHDRTVVRVGMRAAMKAMSSPEMQEFITGESPPPGLPPLTTDSSDAELDERIRALAFSWFHAAGTAAMGQVVDAECRVRGVKGLRVVDASVIPVTIAAHLQAPVYGIAEQAAAMIAASV